MAPHMWRDSSQIHKQLESGTLKHVTLSWICELHNNIRASNTKPISNKRWRSNYYGRFFLIYTTPMNCGFEKKTYIYAQDR